MATYDKYEIICTKIKRDFQYFNNKNAFFTINIITNNKLEYQKLLPWIICGKQIKK